MSISMRISCFRWSTWLLRKSGRDQGHAGQPYKSNGEVMLTRPNPNKQKTKVENWLNAQKCLPTGSENKDWHSKDWHRWCFQDLRTMSLFVSYLPRLWRRRPTTMCKFLLFHFCRTQVRSYCLPLSLRSLCPVVVTWMMWPCLFEDTKSKFLDVSDVDAEERVGDS